MVRKKQRRIKRVEEDPMAGTANLVDAMLVIAVGLLVFLVLAWNMQSVLFNDDLFILNKIKKSDFFKKGLPNDIYVEYCKEKCSKRHENIRNNNLKIINKHFNKKEIIKNNLSKVFNLKYGINNLSTFKCLKNDYSDFLNYHLAQPSLKARRHCSTIISLPVDGSLYTLPISV